MDAQSLLNAPTKSPRVVAKLSKIGSLVRDSNKVKKSSTKLRKIFEKGTYQKKTQLSVLNRYKKRLDAIDKEKNKKLEKKKKDKSRGIVPKIKPFVGTFFKPNADPLKSIAQLAAFNAASKLAKGDVLGTIGPGLTLAAILFGPKLLKMGIGSALKTVGIGRGYEDLLRSLAKKKGLTQGEEAALKNFDRYRKAGLSGEEAAQRALSRGGGFSVQTAREFRKLERGGAGGQIRETIAEERAARAEERAATRGAEGAAEGAGKGALKGGLKYLGPVADVVLAGLDFQDRKQSGQTNLQAGLGAGAGAVGAYAGFEAGAALGAAIGTGFFGVGAVPGAIIGGIVGAIGAWVGSSLASGLVDMITGANKKSSGSSGNKSFADSLDKYEKVVNKFSSYAFSAGGPPPAPIPPGGAPPGGGGATGLMADLQADIGKSAAEMKGEILQSGATGVVDPTNQPWCAAYVNAELRRNGIQGSGSAAANSFLKWGVPVDNNNIQPGDVIVGDYGGGSQSHVMIATSTPSNGYVNIIGGNQSHKVSTGAIALSKIDGARRASSVGPTSTQTPTPPPSAIPSSPRQRSIASYTSYAPSPYQPDENIVLPIPQQMMQQMTQSSSGPMMMSGPSEQEVLNSFYKRVLLNTAG